MERLNPMKNYNPDRWHQNHDDREMALRLAAMAAFRQAMKRREPTGRPVAIALGIVWCICLAIAAWCIWSLTIVP